MNDRFFAPIEHASKENCLFTGLIVDEHFPAILILEIFYNYFTKMMPTSE
jgi:hypothetical protein